MVKRRFTVNDAVKQFFADSNSTGEYLSLEDIDWTSSDYESDIGSVVHHRYSTHGAPDNETDLLPSRPSK